MEADIIDRGCFRAGGLVIAHFFPGRFVMLSQTVTRLRSVFDIENNGCGGNDRL